MDNQTTLDQYDEPNNVTSSRKNHKTKSIYVWKQLIYIKRGKMILKGDYGPKSD